MKRAHVFYSGRVQGIGFRYTAQNIAENLGIYGWVKNLEDGRVEIVAESEEKNLKEFLDKISKGPLGRYIKDMDVAWENPSKEFNDFSIKFDYSSI
ncbi:MAG: acylphosphatase [Candidatus Omnitrophica bacterium]|nr:acylphosphatase [Candidatus Omnitrophota bacterium]